MRAGRREEGAATLIFSGKEDGGLMRTGRRKEG